MRVTVEGDGPAHEESIVCVHDIDKGLIEEPRPEGLFDHVLIPRLGGEGEVLSDVFAQHALRPKDQRPVADIGAVPVREVQELHMCPASVRPVQPARAAAVRQCRDPAPPRRVLSRRSARSPCRAA
jgi:hypothetical protein